MASYTYKFIDGTESVVEISDELCELLKEMDIEERHGNRRERRRHVSSDRIVGTDGEPATIDDYLFETIFEKIENEDLRKAILKLSESQKDLIIRRFFKAEKVKDIAKSLGCASCSVSKKFERIYKKIEEFL